MCYIVSFSNVKGQFGQVHAVLYLRVEVELKIGLHHGEGFLEVTHY